MMIAIYVVLAWSLVGCIAALLIGRAIAICSGDQQSEMIESVATTASAGSSSKALPAAKAA
jgi:hypothetical protein